jgi:hypothetical protein
MANTAFQPSGTTKLIAASSSTAGGEVTQVSTGGQQGMYVFNGSTGSQPVYVAAGSSSVQAAVPTTAVPANGTPIPPLQGRNIATPPAGWLSAVTSAGSVNVFATPGLYGS